MALRLGVSVKVNLLLLVTLIVVFFGSTTTFAIDGAETAGAKGRNSNVDDVISQSNDEGIKKLAAQHGMNFKHLYDDASNLDVGFWHALIASFSVIIVSELGDKTFFIAAILAMRHSRCTVLMGAVMALFLMTVLSVTLGWITQIIPRFVTYYVSTALFAIFGLKMLRDGWKMSPEEGQEEFEEAQEEVRRKEDQMARIEAESLLPSANANDLESGLSSSVMLNGETSLNIVQVSLNSSSPSSRRRTSSRCKSLNRLIGRFLSKIFIESFTLTFLAEWGDRSQLTTIILASRENVAGVTLGGCIGHALCTGLAVLGGRMIAQRISVRTVTLIGGIVFIVFALSALVVNPD